MTRVVTCVIGDKKIEPGTEEHFGDEPNEQRTENGMGGKAKPSPGKLPGISDEADGIRDQCTCVRLETTLYVIFQGCGGFSAVTIALTRLPPPRKTTSMSVNCGGWVRNLGSILRRAVVCEQ